MGDLSIPRTDGGIHVLTAAQAADLAALSLPVGRHNPDGMAVLDAIWREEGDAQTALAAWVVRNAPVVTAAEAQTDVHEQLRRRGYDRQAQGQHMSYCCATEDAVRAAREAAHG